MTTVTSEYAEALFTLAAEENVKNDVAESVKIIKGVISDNQAYIDLLAAPGISVDERKGIIDAAFDGRIHEYAVSFLKLVCERGHIRELFDCIDEYLRLYEESDGILTADVVSAVPLSDAEKEKLKANLEEKLSRRVTLTCTVDESILGGIIVRVDGKVMDGSLKTKLSDISSVIGGNR